MADQDVLTDIEYRRLSRLPKEWIDDVLAAYAPDPGQVSLIAAQCQLQQAWIFAQLDKTYDVQRFGPPFPLVIKQWLISLVDADLALLLGSDPNRRDYETYEKRADQARQDIAQAANSSTGLFSLPLKQGDPTLGAGRPSVRFYSTASPYLDRYLTAKRGKDEDDRGDGTRG